MGKKKKKKNQQDGTSLRRKRELRHRLGLCDDRPSLCVVRGHSEDNTFPSDGVEKCTSEEGFFLPLCSLLDFVLKLGLDFKVVGEDGSALSVMNYHYYYVWPRTI